MGAAVWEAACGAGVAALETYSELVVKVCGSTLHPWLLLKPAQLTRIYHTVCKIWTVALEHTLAEVFAKHSQPLWPSLQGTRQKGSVRAKKYRMDAKQREELATRRICKALLCNGEVDSGDWLSKHNNGL